MLTLRDKQAIFEDETIRATVRAIRARPKPLWAFLNSSFGLFVLSSVVLSSFTFGFTRWRDAIQEVKTRRELSRKLDLEIGNRVSDLTRLATTTFSYTALVTARAAVGGNPENDQEIGRIDQFMAVFPEFRGRSLISLLWELKAVSTSERYRAIDNAFNGARNIPTLISDDDLDMVKARGDEDSTWRFKPGVAQRYEVVLAAFAQNQWKW